MSRIHTIVKAWNDPTDPRILVVAHRGVWEKVPENSLASIAAAAEAGADMVEMDIRRTRDGHYVLLHDPTLDRTTNGYGEVSKAELKEVRKLHLISRDGETEYRIPTLQEALAAVRGRLMANLDVKDGNLVEIADLIHSENLGNQIVIKQHGTPDPFDGDEFIYMPVVEAIDEIANFMEKKHYPAFEIHAFTPDSTLLSEGIHKIHEAGSRVWVNTLSNGKESGGLGDSQAFKDPAVYGRVIDLGADIIQTDRTTYLVRYLRLRNLTITV
jgi:glycerophosphoryl diester phosphodiesterase